MVTLKINCILCFLFILKRNIKLKVNDRVISNQLLKTRETRRGFRHVKEVRMFRYITYPISSISYSIELFSVCCKRHHKSSDDWNKRLKIIYFSYLNLLLIINSFDVNIRNKMLSQIINAFYEIYVTSYRGFYIFLQCRYLHIPHESPNRAFYCLSITWLYKKNTGDFTFFKVLFFPTR